jgi:hypothetical protein
MVPLNLEKNMFLFVLTICNLISPNKRKAIQEDESGTLRTATDDLSYRSRKRQLLEKQANIRLSMVFLPI